MLAGIPELYELDMYGNKVAVITIPSNPRLMSKLETLNLGYNDLAYLPDELDQVKSLKVLKVMNNFLQKVPMRICDMDLKTIDATSNPVIQPPIETCERGICAMKRYYECLRLEEQSMRLTMEETPKKHNKAKKKEKQFIPKFFQKSPSSSSSGRNTSFVDDSSTTRSSSSSWRLPEGTSHAAVKKVTAAATDSGSTDLSSENEVAKASIDDAESTVPAVKSEEVTVNDTLKVIFVGMAMAGKTSMIKRLIEGRDAVIPERDDRTIGVDIYEWDARNNTDRPNIDTRIEMDDDAQSQKQDDVDVKFSVWDFAGQHVFHATHELFFSPRALYVIVWDMGATNRATYRDTRGQVEQGAFQLSYDSSDEEDGEADFVAEEEARRADCALERDIDEKVQFWVERIQSRVPGAAILPVASFNDCFSAREAKRRCTMMKQRLLKHEVRRIDCVKKRLDEYTDEELSNNEGARRLQELLSSDRRPRFIFGTDIVRVSGTQYTGFDTLTANIVDVATGRKKAGFKYAVFRGHVGAPMPRTHQAVRDTVRAMRDRFKVVEWGFFVSTLQDCGVTNVEEVDDALHFLADIGELTYFGDERSHVPRSSMMMQEGGNWSAQTPHNLTQYVFLNPRWLVAAVACILRQDLSREIREVRRSSLAKVPERTFYETHQNCPVIAADDVLLLWQEKKFTKKAAERAQCSRQPNISLFGFLQQILVRFRVFVPIDSTPEMSLRGSAHTGIQADAQPRISSQRLYFLPSLLCPGKPAETWTYKNTDSGKTTLCHSCLFPDGVPLGLMERINAAVLSTIHGASKGCDVLAQNLDDSFQVKEVLCWRSAFFLKLGTEIRNKNGERRESVVKIFCHLADRDSHLCVGSDSMGAGMRRLVVSSSGLVGDRGRKIWRGGYLLVMRAIGRVMREYNGVIAYEKQVFCPECLSGKPISRASSWDWAIVRDAVADRDDTLRCHHGHQVDLRLLTGPLDVTPQMMKPI